MAKATIEKPNGTTITIEGSPEEVKNLIKLYEQEKTGKSENLTPNDEVDNSSDKKEDLALVDVVNTIKTCKEAEEIEYRILDRSSVVNRVLLPLYVVYEYLDNRFSLTTVDIAKITTDLGVQVLRQNAYRSLTGSGSRYVTTDSVKKKGVGTKYKLNRRGEKYMKLILHEEENGD